MLVLDVLGSAPAAEGLCYGTNLHSSFTIELFWKGYFGHQKLFISSFRGINLLNGMWGEDHIACKLHVITNISFFKKMEKINNCV